jgi:hypothetical protein
LFSLADPEAKYAVRGRTRSRATKNPARHPARAHGVVSVNNRFWKILVTRVKRKLISSIKSRVEKRLSRADKTAAVSLGALGSGDATGRKVAPPAGSAAGLVMLDSAA